MTDMSQIEIRLIADLHPSPYNARLHSKRQLRAIARSIEAYGFTMPVLIDENDRILAGHGRVEAAKLLNRSSVPALRASGFSEAQKRAYIVADNKLTERGGWDLEKLALNLNEIVVLDADFDLMLTGMEMVEVDRLLDAAGEDDALDEIDILPSPLPTPVTRLGDVWLLGEHRLICADATDPTALDRLMNDERAQISFVDPPYNVRIDGHVRGRGRARHGEFAMASGEMTADEYVAFLSAALSLLKQHSADGSIHYVCIDWRHVGQLLAAGEATFTEVKNIRDYPLDARMAGPYIQGVKRNRPCPKSSQSAISSSASRMRMRACCM